jgi:hypothetical protein
VLIGKNFMKCETIYSLFKTYSSRMLCRIGAHKWEHKPSLIRPLRTTGLEIEFALSTAIFCFQTGVRRCTRPDCGAAQNVARKGWRSENAKVSKWYWISETEKQRIESMPKPWF